MKVYAGSAAVDLDGVVTHGSGSGPVVIYTEGASVELLDAPPGPPVVDPPAPPAEPHYTDGMQPFEVRELAGAYAPTDSAETLRGSMEPPWNASSSYFGIVGQIQAWSGGCVDGLKTHFSGGGHSDGNNNGIQSFDWSGNERPVGFSCLEGSRSAVEAIPQTWQDTNQTLADGKPPATHTYSMMPMSPKRRRVYRGWSWYWYFDLDRKEWVKVTEQSVLGPGGVVLVSPDETQLLTIATSSGAMARFINPDSGEVLASYKSPWAGGSSQDHVIAHDPKRDRYLVYGSKNEVRDVYTLKVDWVARTVTWTTIKNRTHEGRLYGAQALLYDAALDCFWAGGGKAPDTGLKGDTGPMLNLYRIDAETLDATTYPLAQPIRGQCVGQYGRAILLPQRAIGLIPDAERPAVVIKLPGAASPAPTPPGGGEDEPAQPEEPAPAPEPAPNPTPDPEPEASPPTPTSGVLFEHRFADDIELDTFIRRGTDGNPLTLVDDGDGGRAIRALTYGTSIVSDVPECAAGDLQWWAVADATHLPPTVPCTLFVGKGACIEQIQMVDKDLSGNRVQIKRRMTTQAIKIGDVVTPVDRAPAYPGDGTYTLGIDTTGMWVRPLCALRTEGLPDDIGLSNGAARKVRTWPPHTPNPTKGPHVYFREGYWGHASHQAEYDNWAPRDNDGLKAGARNEAFEGNEFWLAFDARISAEKLAEGQPRTKMLFVQNCNGSGSGQIFWTCGPKHADTRPGDFGNQLVPLTSYADSAAPHGGVLSMPQGYGFGKGTEAWQHPDEFPECRWQGYTGKSPECWRFVPDVWIRFLLHFRPGRDNAPLNPTGQSTSKLTGPWPSETDADYRTQLGLFVSILGQDDRYITITDSDAFTWLFGDQKFQAGYYFYNPPALNALWLGAPGNVYIGSGSVAPPKRPHWIDYRHVVLSRDPIQLPNGAMPKGY